MRRELFIVCVTAFLCSPAESQPNANETAASDIAMADLHGMAVETTVFHQQVIQRNGGQPFSRRQRVDTKFSINDEDKVEGSILATVYGQNGTIQGKPQPISSTLQRPHARPSFGGGDAVWIFQAGTLTNLNVYKAGGAFKREISFSRTSSGLACTVKESYAREDGVGPIVWNSSIDGARISLVRTTQTSATCRVTKKQP